MIFYLVALSIGFVGSLHCLAMCLPLQFALGKWLGLGRWGLLLFHLGRIGTYAVLGLLAGLASQWLVDPAFQKPLAIVLAAFVAVGFAISLGGKRLATGWGASIEKPLLGALRYLQRIGKSPLVILALGILNGLLPCGVVYMALAGTFALTSSYQSGLFMALFGLGTLPALLLGRSLMRRLPNFRYATQVVSLLVVALLLFRAYQPDHSAASPLCAPKPLSAFHFFY